MARTRRTGELKATSFALLGLLATNPSGWSTYELAQQMRRSLRYVWPRAERNLYDEAKLLAERGLARAKHSSVGRRPRTTYTITAQGRRMLRTWLSQPSAPLALESEALLRVFFADHGRVEDLVAAIRSVREEAEATERDVAELVRAYDRDGGPFPDRLHVIALMGQLLFSHREALRRWADWAENEVTSWSSTRLGDGARVPEGVFAQIVASVDGRGAGQTS
jgi:PadR family transcriptional regulator, regulatory protein AphA